MEDELKRAQEGLAREMKAFQEAVVEAKSRFGEGGIPGDFTEKFEAMSATVTDLSEKVRKLDEAPAYKRAFEGPETKGAIPFEVKMRRPSGDDLEMREIHELADTVYILDWMMKRKDPAYDIRQSKAYAALADAIQVKAQYAGGSGAGQEWIPTGFSPDLVMLFELERQVATLFGTVRMPQDPFTVPQQTGRARAYLKAKGANATASKSTTGNVTLTSKTIAAYSDVAYEVEEDAIVAMVPFIRQDLAQALADGEEDALLNGDDSGTHQDSDVSDAADVRKAWKGLRKLAVAGAKLDLAGAPTTTKCRQLRSKLGKYGVNSSRLVWGVSAVGLMHMLGIAEVLTVDKLGPQATLLSGQLASFDGAPVVPSGYVRQDLNAAGVYDGVTTTKTEVLLTFRPGFMIGRRRDPMLETDRNIISGTEDIVASMREDFQPRYAATETLVAVGYNVPNTL